jgi:hypothetical protein
MKLRESSKLGRFQKPNRGAQFLQAPEPSIALKNAIEFSVQLESTAQTSPDFHIRFGKIVLVANHREWSDSEHLREFTQQPLR